MKDLRREYSGRTLVESETSPDPIVQFRTWFADAIAEGIVDVNAMSLATARPDGDPSVRTVLLKDVDAGGFVFFTHYLSAKGRDLAANPRAALLFFWATLERQIRISGAVSRVTRAESEEYFGSRPLDSQHAAWAATQGEPMNDRAELERRFEEVKQRFSGQPVPCPPDWGGYRLAPDRLEFWQGRPGRLHDRLLYTRGADGTWTRTRLAP